MAENTNPWALYDCLIAAIPPELKADEVISGEQWCYVRSGRRVGLAMNLGPLLNTETRPRTLPDPCQGMALRDLAVASKSWNIAEAGLGVAAINAYWNAPDHERVNSALAGEDKSAFDAWKSRVVGKKVVVVGHFMYLERTLGPVCELSILEKRPGPGDYPDSACEFIIPYQDFVFATGVTLVNKTLPRLLELSRRQGLILTGPTTPLSPLLFDFGVRDLQGLVVTDPDLCREVILGKREGTIFDAGKRVGIARD